MLWVHDGTLTVCHSRRYRQPTQLCLNFGQVVERLNCRRFTTVFGPDGGSFRCVVTRIDDDDDDDDNE